MLPIQLCLGLLLAPKTTFPGGAFIENRGQWPAEAQFLSRSPGVDFWITADGAVMNLYRQAPRRARDKYEGGVVSGDVVRMTFEGAKGAVAGVRRLEGDVNFFVGNDQAKWQSHVGRFDEVSTKELYPGVSARYYRDQGAPRYDLIVAPGADPNQVSMRIDGAQGLKTLPNGDLAIETSLGEVQEKGLYAYQIVEGGQRQVPCKMTVTGNHIGFSLGNYDRSRALVVDPLVACTYLGNNGGANCLGTTTDASGNIFVVGYTDGADFPITTGAYQKTTHADRSGFISKLSPDGSKLLFSTFLNGTKETIVQGIALDSLGNPIVTGITFSTDFPVTQGVLQFGSPYFITGFLTKLSVDGSRLVFSSYLGGSDYSEGQALALDSTGNIVVAGRTQASDFPATTGGYQASFVGKEDAFLIKVSPDGTKLLASTFLGGKISTVPNGLCLDTADNAYICGLTSSSDFPTTSGAFQAAIKGVGTCFLSKFSPSFSNLMYSTMIGGTSTEISQSANAVAVDSDGSAVICGGTSCSDFPTTDGVIMRKLPGSGASFIARFPADGKGITYSTLLGGAGSISPTDSANSAAIDGNGNAVVAGLTCGSSFPTTADAYMPSMNGKVCGYVCRIAPDGKSLVYCSYFSGTSSICELDLNRMSFDSLGNATVVGDIATDDLPVTDNAYSRGNPGSLDGFVAKFNIGGATTFSGLTLNPSTVVGGASTTGTVTLQGSAGAGGLTVALKSSSASAKVPASVKIPAGKSSATFAVTSVVVKNNTPVTITATALGVSKTASLSLTPIQVVAVLPASSSVEGGKTASITVTVNGKAPAGGLTATLSSSAAALTVPASVTIPEGAVSAKFTATTVAVAKSRIASVRATLGGASASANISVTPAVISAFTAPSNITGSVVLPVKIILDSPAASTGDIVSLSSDSTLIAPPAAVTVPSGQTTLTFNVTTKAVSAKTVVTLTATLEGSVRSCTVTINPAILSSLTLAATSVKGSSSTTATVTLSGPAGPAGAVINLTSSNGNATVPPTLTLSAGQTSAKFTIQTKKVAANSETTIGAAYAGISKSANLTVTP